MKKLISAMLALVLILCCLPILPLEAKAAYTEGRFKYEVYSGKARLVQYDKTAPTGAVTIPSTLGGYPVTEIAGSAFYMYKNVTQVTIPSTVTKIEMYAFYECSNLRTVTIPDSVTECGQSVFYGCTSLESVTIGKGIKQIPGGLFHNCTNIKTVTIRGVLTRIYSYAFHNCNNIRDVYYGGTAAQREQLDIQGYNTSLVNATWHYSYHNHSWTERVTTAATCTASGVKTRYCDCGLSSTETIPALGHNYSGTPSYTWTQTSGGYQVKAVKYCSRNSSHTVNETVNATYQAIKAPTCTASGQGRYTATFTNAYFSTQTKTVTLPAPGHSYTSVVTKPTCTEKGFTTYTCSKCGYVYKDNYVDMVQHPWDAGTVTKQPTCKEEGERTFTCTVCPATKKETIDKTNDHTYGPWTKVNDSEHKHICSVCNKEEKANHKWNGGEITTQPTCKAEGVKTFTCADCGATRTEPVEKLPHTFGNWTNADSSVHKRTCSKCGAEESEKHTWNSGAVTKQPTCKEEGETTYTCLVCGGKDRVPISKRQEHTYDNDCDTTCNICTFTRTVNHKYASTWSKDETGHWKECTACGHRSEAAKHTPGPEATETTPQTCTACGYIVKPVIDHVCKFEEKWTTDKTGHWYACSGCEKKDRFAEHSFENDCDTDCAVCKYERKTTHSFAQSYSSDKSNHWFACAVCGEKKDVKAHEPGPEATETTAQTCTICEYEIAPALGTADTTEPTEDSNVATETTAPQEKANDGDEEKTEFPWWIVIAVVGITAILGVVLAVKKKKV